MSAAGSIWRTLPTPCPADQASRKAMVWCLALPGAALLFGAIAFKALPSDEARVAEHIVKGASAVSA
jgi:hypothetical protein